ncbi:PepSY domain-containing protein [Lacihabitans sp. LS3-19]|uniref:PepSY-associated TM helix domain-containing protein n=1 Tax=Lacihabitans sp. LS3-19 TaxID=2487335 RepID=UPI0020CF6733|nr:PepSY-associated TM helix domain-containing protein [Lacihabitans sp. LS3-19]MCP9770659.1 PepSY domain-containing protein [Lacihabitans sp. LS3-19]
MRKNKLLRLTYSLHKWTGLITGFFLLIYGLSGSLLVYKDALEEYFYQKPIEVEAGSKPLPLDSLYHIITQKYPAIDGLAWVNPDAVKKLPYHFRLYLNDARLISYDLGALTINQFTGEILSHGRGDDLEVGWIEWIYQLHFSLHLGIPGAALTAIFGLTMLISIITGFLVYRKYIVKVLSFKIKLKGKNWRIMSSEWHRIIGVWSLVFNAIIFFTGFWMNLFAFEKESWERETIPTTTNTLAKASFDKMLKETYQINPNFEPQYIYFPTQENKKFNLRGKLKGQNEMFAGGNAIRFDAQTGKLVSISTFETLRFSEKLEAFVFPLHVGNFGGHFLKIFYIIIGLTPGFLAITGFLLWWRRKSKRK